LFKIFLTNSCERLCYYPAPFIVTTSPKPLYTYPVGAAYIEYPGAGFCQLTSRPVAVTLSLQLITLTKEIVPAYGRPRPPLQISFFSRRPDDGRPAEGIFREEWIK
jgi:hypothetical protein